MELINFLIAVTDYAEDEQGLDPIGSDDMIQDLSKYAQWRFVEEGPAEPADVWEEFTQTSTYRQYWP